MPDTIRHLMLAASAVCVALIAACASNAPMRSAATTDSGRPLSEGLKAYDLEHITLRNDILPETKSIAGSAGIRFLTNVRLSILELDFDGLFSIDRIEDANGELAYTRDEAKLYISLADELAANTIHEVTVHYHGRPIEAERAPWDGGFVWDTTPSGKPWIATAMQGEGCDIWFPCKDHPSGEPKSLDLFFTVPAGLTAASNGLLIDVAEEIDGRKTFHWHTDVQTNTYGIALNVAPYVLIESSFTSSNGK